MMLACLMSLVSLTERGRQWRFAAELGLRVILAYNACTYKRFINAFNVIRACHRAVGCMVLQIEVCIVWGVGNPLCAFAELIERCFVQHAGSAVRCTVVGLVHRAWL